MRFHRFKALSLAIVVLSFAVVHAELGFSLSALADGYAGKLPWEDADDMAYGEATAPVESPEPLPTINPNESLAVYYYDVIVPQMDKIGNNMRSLFNSQSEIKNAFETAKQGVEALEAACGQVPVFANDAELMEHLSAMKSDILAGLKYCDELPANDPTIMRYQQSIAWNLRAFMENISNLL